MPEIFVIIPVLNEVGSIQKVIDEIPSSLVEEIIVVDNGSNDGTVDKAESAGATVLIEPERGYGAACLKGLAYLDKKEPKPGIVVFLDGDYSDFPGEIHEVVRPILEDNKQLVIGSRVLGNREPGSMTLPQIFGNWLATRLIYWIHDMRFTDLGPFRAVSWQSFEMLNMTDRNYGWTVEMQVKAAKLKMNCQEVPVSYRKRIGRSKVSGTLKGTILAGYKILLTIAKHSRS